MLNSVKMIATIFLISLGVQVCSMPVLENNSSLTDCVVTGPDILKNTKEMEFVKATFLLNSSIVYYLVKFCGRDRLCLATTIEHKVFDLESNNMINDINLWARLIGVIMGYIEIEPYLKLIYDDQYDSSFFDCKENRNFMITGTISNDIILKISKVRENLKPSCINNRICRRHCLHQSDDSSKCSEMTLNCFFNKCDKEQ